METCRAGKRDFISSAADLAASGVLNERFVCLSIEVIAFRVRLLLLEAHFLRPFRFNNLLCGNSEMALRHNPLLLAAHWWKAHDSAASKQVGQLTQYAGALFDVARPHL